MTSAAGTWWRSTASAPSRASAAARPPHRRPSGSRPTWPPTPTPAPWPTSTGPTSATTGGTVAKVKQLFTALYNGGADVLLVGHQHIYERFRPQSPSGAADSNGVRQFIVGTGGRSQTALASPPPTGSETRNSGTFGVLKLTLHPTSYDWQFAPEAGKTFTDTGTQACH